VDTTEITHISLCSGYGGIDLGLRRVISNLRTVAYAEIEAFAIECLLARMEGGQIDAAPIWSDLKSFPWAEFSGMVDILSGGYPCQPFSAAGKRAGADDLRHLWPFISSGIQVVRPRLCFFENVEGHISLGLREVIADLESLGYETAWGIFSAAECGAPHQRKRVFILAANTHGNGIQGHWRGIFARSNRQGRQSCQAVSDSEFATIDWQSESASGLIGANDGGSDWMDRVRLLGNGVVPATAELAFRTLLSQL
jgi:DNA (cytosine-5)-methyltransferase 1